MFDIKEVVKVVKKIKTAEEILKAYKDGKQESTGLIVTGTPDFSNKNLRGIKLKDCTIINGNFKNADLTDADLSGSDLSNSVFAGAMLKNTNLSHTNLYSSNLKGAKFQNANLSNSSLVDAAYDESEIKQANTKGAVFESLKGKRMTAQDIKKAYIEGRKDFSGVIATGQDFSDMKLPGIILSKANLGGSWLDGADLTGAKIDSAELTNCSFRRTTFKNTNCSGATFFWSVFENCIFDGANFRKANITWCKIANIDLASADVTDTDFSWSVMEGTELSETQIASMGPESLVTVKRDKTEGGESTIYGQVAGGIIGRSSSTYGAIDRRASSESYGSIISGEETAYMGNTAGTTYAKKKGAYN